MDFISEYELEAGKKYMKKHMLLQRFIGRIVCLRAHKRLPSKCTQQEWKEKGMVNTFACPPRSYRARDIVQIHNYRAYCCHNLAHFAGEQTQRLNAKHVKLLK